MPPPTCSPSPVVSIYPITSALFRPPLSSFPRAPMFYSLFLFFPFPRPMYRSAPSCSPLPLVLIRINLPSTSSRTRALCPGFHHTASPRSLTSNPLYLSTTTTSFCTLCSVPHHSTRPFSCLQQPGSDVITSGLTASLLKTTSNATTTITMQPITTPPNPSASSPHTAINHNPQSQLHNQLKPFWSCLGLQ